MRYWIYKLARLLVKTVLAIFYPNTRINNSQYLHFKNPCIVVTNHPNTLMDPLNAASRIDQHAFFLVNASLLNSAIGNWFFTNFYCIPIERAKDTGGRKISNEDSFAKCDEFLRGGGCLYIAPQGLSQIKRRIDSIKTGTARIALSAASKTDFQLDLDILPFGLNYESPRHFRSDLLVNIGPPIKVTNYKAAYEKDPFGAAQLLTSDLQKAMEALLPDTRNDEEDLLVRRLSAIQQSENDLDPVAAFRREKRLVQVVQDLEPTAFEQLKTTTTTYYEALAKKRITDQSIKAITVRIDALYWIKVILLAIIGFPFFFYGFVMNFWVVVLPGILTKVINIYSGYDSNIKAISGMILLPLFYGIQTWLCYEFTNSWWQTGLYLITLYPLGVLAWKYVMWFKRVWTNFKAKLTFSNKKAADILLSQRSAILTEMTRLSPVIPS